MNRWEDLAARARGLGSRLSSADERRQLSRSRSLAEYVQALRDKGYRLSPDSAGPAQVDIELRRHAGKRHALVRRWAGSGRSDLLGVVFEEDDIRAIRSSIRGAMEGAPAEARLATLVPTAHLSQRALEVLAEQPSPGAVVTLLNVWRHPYGPALRRGDGALHSEVARLENMLLDTYAERATGTVRSFPDLAEYVRRTVDLTNARKVLWYLAQSSGREAPAFTAGGGLLGERVYRRLVAAADREQSLDILTGAFSGTPYYFALKTGAEHPERLEAGLSAARERELARRARVHPLGPEPVLHYLVGLRLETISLSAIAWGLGMGAPADQVATLAGVGLEGGGP